MISCSTFMLIGNVLGFLISLGLGITLYLDHKRRNKKKEGESK